MALWLKARWQEHWGLPLFLFLHLYLFLLFLPPLSLLGCEGPCEGEGAGERGLLSARLSDRAAPSQP